MENKISEFICKFCNKPYGMEFYCEHYNGGSPTVIHPYIKNNSNLLVPIIIKNKK